MNAVALPQVFVEESNSSTLFLADANKNQCNVHQVTSGTLMKKTMENACTTLMPAMMDSSTTLKKKLACALLSHVQPIQTEINSTGTLLNANANVKIQKMIVLQRVLLSTGTL